MRLKLITFKFWRVCNMAREENTAILEIERNFYKNIDEKKRKRENDEGF